jgi:peptidyl-dipeptidase Dcp
MKPMKNCFVIIVLFLSLFINCYNETNDKTKNELNPLLKPFTNPFELPPFSIIKDEHFKPAIQEAIDRQNQVIERIINCKDDASFENTILPFDTSGIFLDQIINIFNILLADDATQNRIMLSKDIYSILSDHETMMYQNQILYSKISSVYKEKKSLKLDNEKKTLLEKIYNDFYKRGAFLENDKKTKLKEIFKDLEQLKIEFFENYYNDINLRKIITTDSIELIGLPAEIVEKAKKDSETNSEPGNYLFYLNKSNFVIIMKFAENRSFREKVYNEYINLANNNNEYDNKKTVYTILQLKAQIAKIFGFNNYAEYVFEYDDRIAKTPKNTVSFLDSLSKKYFKLFNKQTETIQEIVIKEGYRFKVKPWDWYYYSEKYKNDVIQISDNELWKYFELENTLNGLFNLLNTLFEIKITERKDLPLYKIGIRTFEVNELSGQNLGIIYLSFYSNSTNTGIIRNQFYKDQVRVLPVVQISFNFNRDLSSGNTFLTLDETKNLYHEFGHALHVVFSDSKYFNTSGMNVPVDFVELPSQYIEQYALNFENLKLYSKHFETGEAISDELINKINDVESFNHVFKITETIVASYLDMELHQISTMVGFDVEEFENELNKKIRKPDAIESKYKSTNFTHIFSGEYGAGYYTYLYDLALISKVLNSENKLFDKETAESPVGRRLRLRPNI